MALMAGGVACQSGGRFAEGYDSPASVAAVAPARAPRPATASPYDLTVPPPPAVVEAAPEDLSRFPAAWAAGARSRTWRYIVVHHSATAGGSAKAFDNEHRGQGWDELGYHFVIGNGSDTPDGTVEVGPRWRAQKHGAHAKTPDNRFNEYGVGICLVGNFEYAKPSAKQLESLSTLTAFLMARHRIPASAVIGHQDTGKSTACPGQNLETQLASVRRLATRAVANGFAASPGAVTASAGR